MMEAREHEDAKFDENSRPVGMNTMRHKNEPTYRGEEREKRGQTHVSTACPERYSY